MESRRNIHRCLLQVGICAPFMVLGCAHDPKPKPRVAEPLIIPRTPPPLVWTMPEEPPSAAILVVSQSVRDKCALPETPSGSLQFDFDEAALRPRGEDILERIATCMREGSLKDQRVTVIGHADPRGEESYNYELGLERAKTARDYLIEQGAAMSAVQLESRGEEDAQGSGPESWQLDRRVEIEESPPNDR